MAMLEKKDRGQDYDFFHTKAHGQMATRSLQLTTRNLRAGSEQTTERAGSW